MKSAWTYVLFACVAATAVVVLWTPLPLGVPGEWTWQRHAPASGLIDVVERFFPAVFAAALFVITAEWGLTRTSTAGQRTKLLCYSILLAVSAFWIYAVQKSTPVTHRDVKPLWVLYAPSSSGYFFEATFRIDSTSEFLADYEDRMNEGDVLHIGTHPPGLFLLSKGCLQVCRSSPGLVSVLQSFQGRHERDAFRILENSFRLPPPLDDAELAALQLLGLLTTGATILTIIPLALLSRQFFDSATTWKICCLWSTLPCLSVFLPKSDMLFPFTGTLVLMLMVRTLLQRRQMLLAVLAGLVLWAGLMLSLAHLPVVFLLSVFVVIRAFRSNRETLRHDATALCLLLGTVGIAGAVWTAVTDCNIFRVWYLNLTNHEGFYRQYPRTWWKWLLVNPVELAFAIGLPVTCLLIVNCWKVARSAATSLGADSGNRIAICVAAIGTWAALWLSGKNQGEAARLWCFLTPWLLLVSGLSSAPQPDDQKSSGFRFLLAAQLIAAVLTVSHISGFSFGEGVPAVDSAINDLKSSPASSAPKLTESLGTTLGAKIKGDDSGTGFCLQHRLARAING